MSIQDFRIGAGALKWNGNDVGHTNEEGAVVNYEPNIHLHKSGKYGTSPVKASLIGQNVTIVVNMAESTLANMERVMAGTTIADGKLRFGGVAGRQIPGGVLELDPFDGTPSWFFRNAVPTGSVEVAYQAETERILSVEFTGMVDFDAPEASNIAYVS